MPGEWGVAEGKFPLGRSSPEVLFAIYGFSSFLFGEVTDAGSSSPAHHPWDLGQVWDPHSHGRRFWHLAQSECSTGISSHDLVLLTGGFVGVHPGARSLAPARRSPAASDDGALPSWLLAGPTRIPVLSAEMPSPMDRRLQRQMPAECEDPLKGVRSPWSVSVQGHQNW